MTYNHLLLVPFKTLKMMMVKKGVRWRERETELMVILFFEKKLSAIYGRQGKGKKVEVRDIHTEVPPWYQMTF